MKRIHPRIVVSTSLGVAMALSSLAQDQAARPAYEVASIKLNTATRGNSGVKEDKAQVIFTNTPLKRLIVWAYQVYPFQVRGPGWLDDVYFDISAKYPSDTKDEDRPLMLRTLPEDRLKLAVHRESKEMQGYALVIAKGGFKLKPVEPDASVPSRLGSIPPGLDLQGGFRNSTLLAKKVSMSSLPIW
jgi:uncharacterized protein (TIGR03435 family)